MTEKKIRLRRYVAEASEGRMAAIELRAGMLVLGLGWVLRYDPRTKRLHFVNRKYDSGNEHELQLHIFRLRIGYLWAKPAK